MLKYNEGAIMKILLISDTHMLGGIQDVIANEKADIVIH